MAPSIPPATPPAETEPTPSPTPIPTPVPAPTPTPTPTPAPQEPIPQGLSPFAMAITEDGEYAYIGFDISEVVFKIRLEDFTVETVADLSEYFPAESEYIALDPSEEKLFVHARSWRKLLVLDTRTMSLIRTVDDIGHVGMIGSRYDSSVITWDGGYVVKFVNTESYEVTEFRDNRMNFVRIRESNDNPDKWYVVSGGPSEGYSMGLYDHKAKEWSYEVSLPMQRESEAIFDLEVLPNEEKAYVATMGGWYPDYHAYGWLYSVDLVGGKTKVIPVDGGALCLEASPDGMQLYVGTGWPMPDVNNLLVLDTESDSIMGQVNLGRNKYGGPHTQINDLQIHTANPRFLYATVTDSNDLVKVDLDKLTVSDALVFNNESYRPHFFVERPGQASGYIFIHQSAKAFELDLDKATIKGIVELSLTRDDAYVYDGAIDDSGRLLIAQG